MVRVSISDLLMVAVSVCLLIDERLRRLIWLGFFLAHRSVIDNLRDNILYSRNRPISIHRQVRRNIDTFLLEHEEEQRRMLLCVVALETSADTISPVAL